MPAVRISRWPAVIVRPLDALGVIAVARDALSAGIIAASDPGNHQRRSRHGNHHAVHTDTLNARERRWSNGHERTDCPPCAQYAEHAANGQQRDDFGNRLEQQTSTRRTQGEPQRELTLPRRGPRAEQVRQIEAGNQQQAGDGAEQHIERRPHLRHGVVEQRSHADAHIAIADWKLAREAGADRRHLALRLLEGDSRLQAGDGPVIVGAILSRQLRLAEGQRRPDLELTIRVAKVAVPSRRRPRSGMPFN